MSPISRCTAKATSTTRASTTRRNIQSRLAPGRVTRETRTTASQRNSPRSTFTSFPYRFRRLRRARSIAPPRRRERRFSTTRLGARPATCRQPSPSPDGTCTRPRKLASTISRPSARPTTAIAPCPLRALWSMDKIHKGGFYHDGRFATLNEVVDHYDGHFKLSLSTEEKRNLIEYLKSL